MELGESDRQIRGPNRVNEEKNSFPESWFYLDYFNFQLIALLKRTVRGQPSENGSIAFFRCSIFVIGQRKNKWWNDLDVPFK